MNAHPILGMEPALSVDDPFGVLERLEAMAFEPSEWHDLNLAAHGLSLTGQFERAAIVERVKQKIRILPHQIETALRVLNDLGHRALLADEVGLGKTVEAGIVLKEYLVRGLVERVLILTPAPLVRQWQGELEEKFGEGFITPFDEGFRGFEKEDRLICSMDRARQPKNAPLVQARPWDLLIVDEAHRLRNVETKLHQFVAGIDARYFLMLTATPIQNNLFELFNLIDLLKPGHLGTRNQFGVYFVGDRKAQTLENEGELRELLGQVMVRNRRAEVGLQLPDRHVHDIMLDPSPQEAELYRRVIGYIADQYDETDDGGEFDAEEARRTTRGIDLLRLMTLERELVSSSQALAATLRKIIPGEPDPEKRVLLDELYELCLSARDSTKASHLLELARRLDTPLIVFTQFISTQEHLRGRLEAAGLAPVVFNGSMSPSDKELAIQRFKERGGVLLCTDSGSEGRNLQFANVLVNYDLPWNPMRLEQRIGRIHRIGQERDVHVFNLTLAGTIEDHILTTLYRKIDLVTAAVGDMDLILSKLPEGVSFEHRLFELSLRIKDKRSFDEGMKGLADEMAEAKELAEKVHQLDDRVLERFDLSTLEDAGVRIE